MKIRTMKISDYNNVYELWKSCPGVGLNDLDDSKKGIKRFLKRNPDTCFVAQSDEKIIGSILAGSDGRRGYIYHACVLPDYQRQGIGKILVDAVMKSLKEIGINKAALVVFDSNENGNAFWESQGFFKRNDLVYRNKNINEFKIIDIS